MPQVSETIEIKASPKKCYEVITDYERYPEFLENVADITVSNQKGESCEVTYGLNLIKRITYTLKMTGKPPNHLEWKFARGDIMKKNEGHWELKEVKKGVTLATYQLDIELGLFVPGAITKKLVGKSLPDMLKAFKTRIEAA